MNAMEHPVTGPLTLDSVTDLYRTSTDWFSGAREVSIDLAGVTRVDSAGLALLVEWLRLGRQGNSVVRFRNVPDSVLTLVRINGLQEIIRNHPA